MFRPVLDYVVIVRTDVLDLGFAGVAQHEQPAARVGTAKEWRLLGAGFSDCRQLSWHPTRQSAQASDAAPVSRNVVLRATLDERRGRRVRPCHAPVGLREAPLGRPAHPVGITRENTR